MLHLFHKAKHSKEKHSIAKQRTLLKGGGPDARPGGFGRGSFLSFPDLLLQQVADFRQEQFLLARRGRGGRRGGLRLLVVSNVTWRKLP